MVTIGLISNRLGLVHEHIGAWAHWCVDTSVHGNSGA